MTLPDRFWAKTTRSDCIVWVAAQNSRGYPQPPATETAPAASPCAPVLSTSHVSAAGSTSESRSADLLAHLRDVSRLREARMAELERVRALRGAR